MSVVFRLSALLKLHRSSSVYRSFSALAALIPLSYSNGPFGSRGVYSSFAADGCIFHLETLALSLGDSCAEKEYLLALFDLGRAVFIAVTDPIQGYDETFMRAELLDAIHLQQYVPSPPDTTLPNTFSLEPTAAPLLPPLAKRPSSLQKHTFPFGCPLTLLPAAPLKRPILPFFSSYAL